MNYLVYDIGGTYIKYGLIDEDQNIKKNSKIKTPKTKSDFLISVKDILEEQQLPIDGIAVSMPGKIDVFKGYAYSAGVLDYLNNTNIVDLFHEFTDVPVSVENDGKCAALAEAWMGSLSNRESGVVLVFGTGIGGGIVINNKLYRGYNGIAGEFSFVNHLTNQEESIFGSVGSVGFLLEEVEKAKKLEVGSLSGEKLFELIAEKDRDAILALRNFCDAITYHIFNLQHIFDPEIFAIGGGISEQKLFIEALEKSIYDYSVRRENNILVVPRIVPCDFRNDANLIGALFNYHLNKVTKDNNLDKIIYNGSLQINDG